MTEGASEQEHIRSPGDHLKNLQNILHGITRDNLTEQLPQILYETQEVLISSWDHLLNLVPQRLVDTETVNQKVKEFITSSFDAIKGGQAFSAEIPPKIQQTCEWLVTIASKSPVKEGLLQARKHFQVVDGITCIVESLAGKDITGTEMKDDQRKLAIAYGSLELFELIDKVPRTNIIIPEKLKRLSRGARWLIWSQLPSEYQQIVKEPKLHQKTVTSPAPIPAPAAA